MDSEHPSEDQLEFQRSATRRTAEGFSGELQMNYQTRQSEAELNSPNRGESDRVVQSVELSSEAANLIAEQESAFEQLAPQQLTFERRTSLVTSLVVEFIAVVACVLVAIFNPFWWSWLGLAVGWLLLTAVLLFSTFWWPSISYRNRCWRITSEGMEIRRGVLWKHRIAIPVARVQHVDVTQGPVQRMFDLSTLVVHTAGTKNASISLEGLAHARAMTVRDALIAQKEALDVT